MNKKLSLVILLLALSSLLSVLLVFMTFSQSNKTSDIDRLKTGYEQLASQVNEIKESISPSEDIMVEEVVEEEDETEVDEEELEEELEVQVEENTNSGTQEQTTQKTLTATSNLNVRATASKSGAVVTVLSPGAVVTPTGNVSSDSEGTSWTEVTDSTGKTGWAATSYLK